MATWHGENWARPHNNRSLDKIFPSVGCLHVEGGHSCPIPSESVAGVGPGCHTGSSWVEAVPGASGSGLNIDRGLHSRDPATSQPAAAVRHSVPWQWDLLHRHHRPVVLVTIHQEQEHHQCVSGAVSRPSLAPACSTYTCCLLWRDTSHCFPPPQTWFLQLLFLFSCFILFSWFQNQNGSVVDGLTAWKRNVDKRFEGVEECYICFFILHGSTYQMPKVACPTCKKKFHSACLYKWFSTSQNSTCPLCRNLFWWNIYN